MDVIFEVVEKPAGYILSWPRLAGFGGKEKKFFPGFETITSPAL